MIHYCPDALSVGGQSLLVGPLDFFFIIIYLEVIKRLKKISVPLHSHIEREKKRER